MKKMIQMAPKVIKVVNLKRFTPETQEKCNVKRSRRGPGVRLKSSNPCETIDNNQDNEYTEREYIDQNVVENTSGVQNCSESHPMVQISSRSKIKFRKCSHTPEELFMLHEHTDDTLVKVGDVFDTRDCFKKYINDNAIKWHYYYVCRNSKKKIIEYNCICMAYNLKQREVVIRKQKKRTTACPCKIRLAIDQMTQKVVVYYVCNHHDHPTTANAFYHYPHAKYLPQHVKDEFLDLTYLGLDVLLIQKYIHSVVGLTIKKKDIWSYAYKFKKKIYKRSLSFERLTYMESLMTKLRETYSTSPDTTEIDVANNIIIGTSTDDSINYSEDSLLKEVHGDSTIEDTEVIVQYINEDGVLCDETGVPVTNSYVIQLINNYTYVTPDEQLEQTVYSELADSDRTHQELREWEFSHNKSAIENNVTIESETYVDNSEGTVSNDAVADESTSSECLKQDGAVMKESGENRLYVEMDNFKKYFYVDHQYALDLGSGEEKSRSDSSHDPNLEKHIKAPDFVSYPATTCHCSGHDHLTLLTDADIVLPGAKFLTHDEFLTYVNERAARWFFYYSLLESGSTPENYVYKCVYGKKRVFQNPYQAKGLKKRNNLMTDCPCQIRLRRTEADPTYLTVLYSCNHHDHALDARPFVAQPHSRQLPGHIKEEIKDLIYLRVSFDVLRKYVAAETGLRVNGTYFHHVRASMLASGECRRFTKQHLAVLRAKIRDLEAIYGHAAKENPRANIFQNQTNKRMSPSQAKESPAANIFQNQTTQQMLPPQGFIARYGNAIIINPDSNIFRNQTTTRMLPSQGLEAANCHVAKETFASNMFQNQTTTRMLPPQGLGDTYGRTAKENRSSNIIQNQTTRRMLPPQGLEATNCHAAKEKFALNMFQNQTTARMLPSQDSGATYGHTSKDSPASNIFQNHTTTRMLPLQGFGATLKTNPATIIFQNQTTRRMLPPQGSEATFGHSSKTNPEANIFQNQATKRKLPSQGFEHTYCHAAKENPITASNNFQNQTIKRMLLSQDTLPAKETMSQSRLQTRPQKLSHKDTVKKEKNLQASASSSSEGRK